MACRDLYGEELRVGDKVIGVISLLCGFTGTISKISENSGVSYITLLGDNGEIIVDESKFFTTAERLKKYHTLDFNYSIKFFGDQIYPLFTIPLTSAANFDFDISDDVCLAYINFYERNGNSEIVHHIISLRSNEDTEIFSYNGSEYILNNNSHEFFFAGSEEDFGFESREKLNEAVRKIIECFQEPDKDDETKMAHVKTKVLKKPSM